MVGTGKLSRVLWHKYHDIWFLALSSKSTGERNQLVHFCYCHCVIKYLMRDVMDCHCLRLFRSRDRRIGKHSPGFSVFRTRVCDAEPCRVPIQSTFVDIVPFEN